MDQNEKAFVRKMALALAEAQTEGSKEPGEFADRVADIYERNSEEAVEVTIPNDSMTEGE